MTKRIVVAGGTGLIGRALVGALQVRGDDVVVLPRGSGRESVPTWDPVHGVLDAQIFVGADAVVTLNGAGIGDKRWTAQRKAILRSSRIRSVRLVAETMAEMENPARHVDRRLCDRLLRRCRGSPCGRRVTTGWRFPGKAVW